MAELQVNYSTVSDCDPQGSDECERFDIGSREVIVLMYSLNENEVPEVVFNYTFTPESKWPESLDERLRIELSEKE